MTIETRAVRVAIYGQGGNPAAGAVIRAKLSHQEIAAAAGYVVSEITEVVADENGEATLSLWPNALGSTASNYRIWASPSPTSKVRLLDVEATIPDRDCDLLEVAYLSPYPGKPDGQLAADNAAASADEAAASAESARISAEIAAAAAEANDIVPAIAQTAISGHTVVAVFAGRAAVADRAADYDALFGLATHAANQDDTILVLLSGTIAEPSWAFFPGPVYLADNGAITQSAPSAGPLIRVGHAISQTELAVDFNQPIMQE